MRRFTLLFCFLVFAHFMVAQKEFPKVKYDSKTLTITQLTPQAFLHISHLYVQGFGKVSCNGLIVVDNDEALVFDTPVDDIVALELINWVETQLGNKIEAVVATHFHDDCLGGLNAFHERKIKSYALEKTAEFAKKDGVSVPQNVFRDSLSIPLGTEKILLHHIGEGHTRDNIIGYFPKEGVLFGGCLVKSLGAGKGYLGDANVGAWPKTVSKLKVTYKNASLIIPGHGKPGGKELLDYTIDLFSE